MKWLVVHTVFLKYGKCMLEKNRKKEKDEEARKGRGVLSNLCAIVLYVNGTG